MSLGAQILGRDNIFHKIGNVLGLGIPNWLDDTFGSDAAEGPALGEMAVQTSKEGVDRPIVYGICRPIGGNLIAVQDPPLILQVEQESQGGKGGGNDEPTMVDTPFRTYAVRICEGEITGIRRVWRNSKLVYDARGNEWGAANNGVFLALAKFYFGSFEQLPAPELQSVFGVEAVTAYRGTAYMTITQENLGDMSGAVPQYIFEVERAEGYALTSRPYPIELIEGVDTALSGVKGAPSVVVPPEAIAASGPAVIGGELRVALRGYEGAPEAIETGGPAIVDGSLRATGVPFVYAQHPEAVDTAGPAILGGSLAVKLVTYTYYPPEAVDVVGPSILSGSLT